MDIIIPSDLSAIGSVQPSYLDGMEFNRPRKILLFFLHFVA